MSVLDDDDKKWLRKNFLTRSDAKNFLTRSDDDINAIKDLVTSAVEETIEKKQLVTKNDISHLPTKEEFYDKMDELMSEIKASREENSVYSAQVNRLAEKVERHHPSN